MLRDLIHRAQTIEHNPESLAILALLSTIGVYKIQHPMANRVTPKSIRLTNCTRARGVTGPTTNIKFSTKLCIASILDRPQSMQCDANYGTLRIAPKMQYNNRHPVTLP